MFEGSTDQRSRSKIKVKFHGTHNTYSYQLYQFLTSSFFGVFEQTDRHVQTEGKRDPGECTYSVQVQLLARRWSSVRHHYCCSVVTAVDFDQAAIDKTRTSNHRCDTSRIHILSNGHNCLRDCWWILSLSKHEDLCIMGALPGGGHGGHGPSKVLVGGPQCISPSQ